MTLSRASQRILAVLGPLRSTQAVQVRDSQPTFMYYRPVLPLVNENCFALALTRSERCREQYLPPPLVSSLFVSWRRTACQQHSRRKCATSKQARMLYDRKLQVSAVCTLFLERYQLRRTHNDEARSLQPTQKFTQPPTKALDV